MAIEIRSYRSVFDLERRIYRVDRVRLNPGGVPVRGVVYFIALFAASALLAALPGLHSLAQPLPWYLREVAFPAGSAALLAVIRIEGRPAHLAAWALLRFAAGPRHLTGAGRCSTVGRRWRVDEILVLPDGSDGRLRRLRYTGPGAALVTVAHERAHWGGGPTLGGGLGLGRRGLTLRELPGRRALRSGQVIALASRARLDVLASLDVGRVHGRAHEPHARADEPHARAHEPHARADEPQAHDRTRETEDLGGNGAPAGAG